MSMPAPRAPAHRTECDPEFVAPPTAKLYYLRSKRRPNTNFIRAEITPADYFVYDVENTPDDGLGCPGPWLFELAWDHFIQIWKQHQRHPRKLDLRYELGRD
jgi:hypothetical protein